EHLGREIRQQRRPDPFASGLLIEPRGDGRDACLWKRLDVLTAPLRVAGVYGDRWRVPDQRKGLGRQRRQFGTAQACVEGEEVQHFSVLAAYPSDWLAGPGCLEQKRQLFLREAPALPSNIDPCVHVVQVGESVAVAAPVLDHPVEEGL